MDVVVVSYNSRHELHDCLAELSRVPWINVIVVDNESSDGSLDSVADLRVDAVPSGWNGGFAFGVNTGWKRGSAPYVLLLNPDARIDAEALSQLADVLDNDPSLGIAAPRIEEPDGHLDFSQRRFPRLVSTYAQALFLHRLFPRASWTDEVIRDPAVYETDAEPDWVSGACLLIRRTVLTELRGLDETFFMYGEDKDLCRRVWASGARVRFVAGVRCTHVGGTSTPRAASFAMLATSRRRYATKHRGGEVLLDRIGIALGHLTHLFCARGADARAGHLVALRSMFGPLPPPPSRT